MPHTHNTRSNTAAAAATTTNNAPIVDGINDAPPSPTSIVAPPAATVVLPQPMLAPATSTLNSVTTAVIERTGVAEHLDERPTPVFNQDTMMLDASADAFLAPDFRFSSPTSPSPTLTQAMTTDAGAHSTTPSTAPAGTGPPVVTPPSVAPPVGTVAILKTGKESESSDVSNITGESLKNPYSHISIMMRESAAPSLAAASAHAQAADLTEGAALAAGTFNTDVPDFFPTKDPTEVVFVLLSFR